MNPRNRMPSAVAIGSMAWALVPLFSIGMLTPFVFLYAAARRHERWLWFATGAYALACTSWLVFASMPERSAGPILAGILLLVLPAVGTTHAFLVRRRVFAPMTAPPEPQPALRAALQARQKRAEARAIAARDAALATELRIGRPDIPHEFDDGGLVDINHVPPAVLINTLGLSAEQASSLVIVRDRRGGFTSPEELVVYTELAPDTIERIQDRMVLIA